MEKVAQLVKAAKDKYLSDNERLGTVGTATRTGAHGGARVGGVLGALGGAAAGALEGASTRGSKVKKALHALAIGAGGAIAGAGAGALGGGVAGGSLGAAAGSVRAGKRALYGQESVSKVEHNTRKMLSKQASERLKGSAEVLAGTGLGLAGVHAGKKMGNAGLRIAEVYHKKSLKHIEKGDWVKAERALNQVSRGGKKFMASKLVAAAGILGGAGLAYKGARDALKK